MTTSSVSSSSSTNSSVNTSSSGGTLQVTGLASGLDTASLVSQMMDIQKRPLTALQNQQKQITARNAQLSNIQLALKTVNSDALALMNPSLYRTSQTASSSDSTRVAATTTSGAGVGGYLVSVSQLANASQRTFSFTSPSSDTTITIDGHNTSVAAGASVYDLADAINNDKSATVYAAATDSGTLVFSSRDTGDTGSDFIQVSGADGVMSEQTSRARQGQNALYSVDGNPMSSASNTVTTGIPGVSLTLTGVTTTSGPVTVNVSAPAPDASKIGAAISQFVTDYNSALTTIQTQLSQKPTSSDPTQGTLYGDSGLKSLLASMRSMMYQGGSGLPSGMSSMLDVGLSTGKASGSAGPSASELAGDLTLNTSTLQTALKSNGGGVRSVITTWANNLATVVNAQSGLAGTIDVRVGAANAQLSSLSRRVSTMQSALDDKQTRLTKQFAQLEASLSSNQSTSSWLTSQINSLPGVTSK